MTLHQLFSQLESLLHVSIKYFFKSHFQPLPSGSVSWNILCTPSSSPVRMYLLGNHLMFLSNQFIFFPPLLSLSKNSKHIQVIKKIIFIMRVEFFPGKTSYLVKCVSITLNNVAILTVLCCIIITCQLI